MFVNRTPENLAVHSSFVVRSPVPRELRVTALGAELWSGRVDHAPQVAQTSLLLLPPGETSIEFRAAPPPAVSSDSDGRAVSFRLQRLRVELGPPPAAP